MTTDGHQQAARALLARQYLIVPIVPGDKRPALAEWQNARLGAVDVPRLWSNGAGVGVLCGVGAWPVVGVDIDVHDESVAEMLERWCERHWGATVVRIGQAPKRLLVYRAAEAGWRKVASRVWLDAGGVAHKVEVLGRGQQFVAAGRHPVTRRDFEWTDLVGGLSAVDAGRLPVLEYGALADLVRVFEDMADLSGWTVKGGGAAMGESTERSETSPPRPSLSTARWDQTRGTESRESVERVRVDVKAREATIDALVQWTPPVGHFSLGEVATALKERVSAEDYDTWLRVGMALHHEWGLGGASDGAEDAAAFETWRAWSEERGGDKYAGEEDCRRKWSSFRRGALGVDEGGGGGAGGAGADGAGVLTLRALLGMLGLGERFAGAPGSQRMIRRARTEIGMSERLLDQFGEGLMYVPELSGWYAWTGVYWRRAADVEIEHLAKSTVLALKEEIDLWPDGEEREAFFKFCAAAQKRTMVSNMIALAASDPRVVVPAAELDREWWIVGCHNGAVDLRTGEALPPDPRRRTTKVAGAPYREEARSALWEDTVADVFEGRADMVAFFQRLVGYTLCGRPEEDLLVILYGSGANGKSTVSRTIKAAFGEYARSAETETFLSGRAGGAGVGGRSGGPRPDILALRGSRLAVVMEPEAGAELREGFVKSMAGGDELVARGMYSSTMVEVSPTWTCWISTNHLPIVKGDDYGIWRRLMPIPFTRNFDQDAAVRKDPKRRDRLVEQELPGVLRWCVEGARRYIESGLGVIPDRVQRARSQYRSDMDLLAEWLEECCETGPELAESSEKLWGSWLAFASTKGEARFISSQRALVRRLQARGFSRARDVGARGRKGLVGVAIKKFGGFD